MISRTHSWLYLTNNLDADTTRQLNTSGSAKLEYPCESLAPARPYRRVCASSCAHPSLLTRPFARLPPTPPSTTVGNGNHWTNITQPLPLFSALKGSVPVSFVVNGPINITAMQLTVDPVWSSTPASGLVLASGSRITGNKTLCTVRWRMAGRGTRGWHLA